MSNFPEIGYTPENLKHLIKLKGLTQMQVAVLMGVNHSTVARWLNGSVTMPHEKWLKLLAA
ncbi:MAG TPA: helix-turn-helix transcriptional regulator [Agitococcus sp.]|nr:helix-turn-helix transcriptional regulator [Agitococcus sp.]